MVKAQVYDQPEEQSFYNMKDFNIGIISGGCYDGHIVMRFKDYILDLTENHNGGYWHLPDGARLPVRMLKDGSRILLTINKERPD